MLKSDGTTQNYLYLQRDYQGSILAITDAAAAIVEKRLFDAWGSLINYYNASGAPAIRSVLKKMNILKNRDCSASVS